jgi:hypothetical protein
MIHTGLTVIIHTTDLTAIIISFSSSSFLYQVLLFSQSEEYKNWQKEARRYLNACKLLESSKAYIERYGSYVLSEFKAISLEWKEKTKEQ